MYDCYVGTYIFLCLFKIIMTVGSYIHNEPSDSYPRQKLVCVSNTRTKFKVQWHCQSG